MKKEHPCSGLYPSTAAVYTTIGIGERHTGHACVLGSLTTTVEGLGPIDNINFYSLASSLNTQDVTKTATLIFKRVPTLFDNDKRE
jgi:hypothetical protein